ncbi:hypothetical protein ACQX0N_09380 [Clostridium tepidum]
MNILNLMMYMNISILVGTYIVVLMQNRELNNRCNKIIGKL